MKYNIKCGRNLISIKKAISVYFQLRRAGVSNSKIVFNNFIELSDINIECPDYGDDVHAIWGSQELYLNYKEVINYFFVESGYKGKYILKPNLKI